MQAGFRWALGLFFVTAGINHFIAPDTYLELMPSYLQWHRPLIFVSGLFEVLLGIGVLLPRLKLWAGWGLMFLLIAVFPANVHAALHGFRQMSAWILWVRLPLQFVLLGWVYWCCLRRPDQENLRG